MDANFAGALPQIGGEFIVIMADASARVRSVTSLAVGSDISELQVACLSFPNTLEKRTPMFPCAVALCGNWIGMNCVAVALR